MTTATKAKIPIASRTLIRGLGSQRVPSIVKAKVRHRRPGDLHLIPDQGYRPGRLGSHRIPSIPVQASYPFGGYQPLVSPWRDGNRSLA